MNKAQQRKQESITQVGEHRVTSYSMSSHQKRRQTRARVESELTEQGVAPDAPIRGVVRHSQDVYGKLAVSRSLRTGAITGALTYTHGGGLSDTHLTDLRAQEKHQGAGTALMRHAAREGIMAGDTELSITGAVGSAKPFYNKMGGMTHTNEGWVHWNEEAMRALARGEQQHGHELNGDQFAGYIGGYEPKVYD